MNWFIDMVERVKFARRVKRYKQDGVQTFIFDNKTGKGTAFDHYDMVRDIVVIRYSRNGYVSGEGEWTRPRWEAHVKSLNRDWIRL